MNRTIKSIAGVTLLEIMLVLAIAAMIITMSVKYYGVANNTSHLNAAVEQITALTAAADGIAQNAGSYTSITSASLASVLPTGWNFSPWGSKITVTATASSLLISVPNTPVGICSQFTSRIMSNQHFTSSSTTCSTSASTNVAFFYQP